MKNFNTTKIIGIDHGYGNMKTANCDFKTGILAFNTEPLFTADMLVYNGKYCLIGERHKEFSADKIKDEEYYLLIQKQHSYGQGETSPVLHRSKQGTCTASSNSK